MHSGALRALEFDRIVEAVRPDAVLLDIAMPGMDGIDVARALARIERPPVVIFVTAFDSFAVAAFDIEAVDPEACVTNARRFDTSVFAKSFPREVERAVHEDEHRGPDYRRGPRPRFAWSPGRR